MEYVLPEDGPPAENLETYGNEPGIGGAIVFWLLIGMGVSTLAAAVLLPPWRTYQTLRLAAQVQRHQLAQLREDLQRQQRVVEAMRSDPLVVGRLAQRDLGYHRLDETTVPVPVSVVTDPPGKIFRPEPVLAPAWVAQLVSPLPGYPYERVFCDPQVRPLVTCLSVALIGVAFVFLGRRGGTHRSLPSMTH